MVGDQLLGQLHARLDPRVGVAVVEEDRREAPDALGALPADDLVVVELGQFVREAGSFAFSLICVFQR